MRKEMFTDKGKMPATFWIEVGGNNPDGSQGPGRGGGKVQKETNMLEPVFWHASDPDYFEELAHSYCLSQIYDLTPAEGTAALVFNKLQIPYVGVCLTQLHKEFLSERLEYKHMIQMFSIEPALAAKFPDFSPTQPTSSSPRPPATAPKAAPKAAASKAKAAQDKKKTRRIQKICLSSSRPSWRRSRMPQRLRRARRMRTLKRMALRWSELGGDGEGGQGVK